ncbi:MAG: cyclic nucleotide-binding domain-containing protein [Oceanococcus sp.]
MPKLLPVISSRPNIIAVVENVLQSNESLGYRVEALSPHADPVGFMGYELPDLYVLDFADPGFDPLPVLNEIESDPWLLSGGMVAIFDDAEQKEQLESERQANIIISIMQDEAAALLPNVLRILTRNLRLVSHRGLGADLVGNLAGSFELENNPVDAGVYVNLICNFLFSTGRCDAPQKNQLRLALTEILLNAIEHGNCGIDAEQKRAWLNQGHAMKQLVGQANLDPDIAAKRVRFEFQLQEDHASFRVTDQGAGFDWRAQQEIDPLDLLMEPCGRGIMMAREVTRTLQFNEAGNEASFEVAYQKDGQPLRPELFAQKPMLTFEPGELVIRQGESSDTLYFIADGLFDVIVGETCVGQLSPDDIFLGEMSFLLNAPRTADIVATSSATLIAIDRAEFVAGIRRQPRYALFLAKLLAHRLAENNSRVTGE